MDRKAFWGQRTTVLNLAHLCALLSPLQTRLIVLNARGAEDDIADKQQAEQEEYALPH